MNKEEIKQIAEILGKFKEVINENPELNGVNWLAEEFEYLLEDDENFDGAKFIGIINDYKMNIDNNLQKLRKAIIKEIPEIVELKFGCRIKSKKNPDNVGRYIVKERKEYRGGITFVYYDVVNSLMHDIPLVINCGELENDYKIIGRPITLSDVLRVLNKKPGLKLSSKPNAITISGHFIINGEMVCRWDLSKTLDQQSQETINLLTSLICKKNE